MTESCATCRFWNGEPDAKWSEAACRIRAPRAYPQPDPSYASSVQTVWPETRYNDWCGEYYPTGPFNPTPNPTVGECLLLDPSNKSWWWTGEKWLELTEKAALAMAKFEAGRPERGEFH